MFYNLYHDKFVKRMGNKPNKSGNHKNYMAHKTTFYLFLTCKQSRRAERLVYSSIFVNTISHRMGFSSQSILLKYSFSLQCKINFWGIDELATIFGISNEARKFLPLLATLSLKYLGLCGQVERFQNKYSKFYRSVWLESNFLCALQIFVNLRTYKYNI